MHYLSIVRECHCYVFRCVTMTFGKHSTKNLILCFSWVESIEFSRRNYSGKFFSVKCNAKISHSSRTWISRILVFFCLHPAALSAFRGTYPIVQVVVPLQLLRSKRTLSEMDKGWKMRKCASVSTKAPTFAFASDTIMRSENSTRESHWVAKGGNPKTLRKNLRWLSSDVAYK